MEPTELKKLATLQEKSDTLGKEMEEAQQKAGKAMRAENKAGHEEKPSAPVQRLINKGFKAEFFAFKAGDTVRDFKELMRKKYLK
jgi:hypothetical protein